MRGKTIISVLVVFMILGTYAYAQRWPSAATIVERAKTELNLDQGQYDQVKVIIEENVLKRQQ